jgi:hypothetical protein
MLKFNLPPHKKIKLNLYVVYLLPVLVGLIARAIFYLNWFKSPFRYYHVIIGLDMRKFLIFGEKFYHGDDVFSPYRLFIAAIYSIVGREILPEAVVLGQIFIGLLTIALTVYIALCISGQRIIGFLAGLFMALYAPVIIYETQILKASIFLFLSILSLAAMLYARKKHFTNIPSFIAGVAAILPFFVRHAGFLWLVTAMAWIAFYCRIKIVKKCGICLMRLHKTYRDFKPLLLFSAGSLSFLLIVFVFNKINNFDSSNYFLPNYSYLLLAGADESGDISKKGYVVIDTDSPIQAQLSPTKSASRALLKIKHYNTKVLYIFNNFEMPNNINYYFIKKKLPVSRFFIGPALLMPFALTGMILMIIYGGLHKKESILFFYIAAFAIPICAFLPLGRYKLVLVPVFCIAAAYCLMYLYRILNRKINKLNNILAPTLLAILFFLTISTISYPQRASDDKAYGIAASYIPDKLMQKGDFDTASSILADYYAKNQENAMISLNYASALLGCNRPKDAEYILNKFGIPQDKQLIGRYCYELGETYRMLNEREKALKYYHEVLKHPCADYRKELTRKHIDKLFE